VKLLTPLFKFFTFEEYPLSYTQPQNIKFNELRSDEWGGQEIRWGRGDDLNNVVFSGEVIFYISGTVNRHNC
jgi:hypothetical protein